MRSQSQLSYRRRINRVVAHVQAHLADDLDSALLAEVAAMSRFHFHRVFAALTGMTPAHYVLRTRLAAAIGALRGSSAAVGQIALDCGFESGATFAKSLRREFGVSPSGARQAAIDPRMSLGLAISHQPHRRKTMLQATIRELPSQQLLCATERGAINNDMSATAQRAFGRLFPAAQALGLMPRMTGCLAVCPDEMTSPNDPEMRFIAALSFDGPAPDLAATPGITCDTIPAGRWAVFRHVGPYNTLWQTWRAIYGDWVRVTQPALRDAAPYELYLNDASKTPPQELVTEIHIPVN
ncbi:MAG: AraC family transcriptional regulator [Rhizobacter sp.]